MTPVTLPDDIDRLINHMLEHYLSDRLRDAYCDDRWHERNWKGARDKILEMVKSKK